MLGKRYFKIKGPKLNNIRLLPCGGFTIIEVMVSMAIFTVSILGLAASVTAIMRANQTSYFQTIATNLAQDQLERLKSMTALPNCPTYSTTVGCIDNPTSLGVNFTRDWQIPSPSPVAGVIWFDVRVTWTDYISHTVTVSSSSIPLT